MSRVVFELSDGVDGEIQLRNNEFMDFWKMVFVRNNKLLGPRRDKIIGKKFNSSDNSNNSNLELYNFDYHKICVDEVNKSIDDIKNAGWTWRHGKLNSKSSFEDCNRIHRGFTTFKWSSVTDHLDIPFEKLVYLKANHINFRSKESTFLIPWLDPSTDIILGNVEADHPKSWFSWEKDCLEPLHNINAYVHKLEDKCLLSARSEQVINEWCRLNNKNYQFIGINNLDWNSKGKDGVTDQIQCDWDFGSLLQNNDKHDMCSSDPKYNVYDLKNILGKDYEKAYIDYDNPANWDVTNTYNTTKGGFEIRPWQSYCTKSVIRPWVHEDNLPSEDRYIAPITLGHINESWLEQNFFTEYAWKNNRTIIKVDLI